MDFRNAAFIPVAIWCTYWGEVELQRVVIPRPRNTEELREMLASGELQPFGEGSFCVRYSHAGRYFTTSEKAIAYLFRRWGAKFIQSHLDDAAARASSRLEERLQAEAAGKKTAERGKARSERKGVNQ